MTATLERLNTDMPADFDPAQLDGIDVAVLTDDELRALLRDEAGIDSTSTDHDPSTPDNANEPAAYATSIRGSADPEDDTFFIALNEADDDEWAAAAADEENYGKHEGSLDLVKLYLRQIGKIPLLNAEQEVELGKSIKAGRKAEEKIAANDIPEGYSKADLQWLADDGLRAKAHLQEANLRLVVSVAKRYTGRGLTLLELIQEGSIGLIRATEKYEFTKGYKFSTYATWWIWQGITRAIADQARTVRVPVYMVETISKVARVQRDLEQKFGRGPTPAEIGAELDMEPDQVEEVQQHARQPVSLHAKAGSSEDSSEIGALIPDDEDLMTDVLAEQNVLSDAVVKAINSLPPNYALVIREFYGLVDGVPKSFTEIAKIIGKSDRTAKTWKKKALQELQQLMGAA
ncbi:MAG TPA: sigma-70 family RNA polymerase sigma factor [Candidatus Saccharimonadales bacterium]|nr:sigma-70 family RNA polymerase sigma factor [Candidatus Saccharimonadales bacterium]